MLTVEIVILQLFFSVSYLHVIAIFNLVYLLSSQLELPLEEFEGKLNKSKLKLVLTNGKIRG